MSNNQPTILVKLQDGNSMRMTLAELKVYKETGKLPATEPATLKPIKQKDENKINNLEDLLLFIDKNSIDARPGKYQPSKKVAEVKDNTKTDLAPIATQGLSLTTPVTQVFVDKAAAKMWDSEDHQSLLDERFHNDVVETHTPVSSATGKMLGMVMKQANVSIDPDLFSRFESIINARLKDVRTNEGTKQYLEKSVDQGGMGLSAEKSDAVIAAISAAEEKRPAPEAPLTPVEKKPAQPYIPIHQPLAQLATTVSSNPPGRQSLSYKTVMHDIKPPSSTASSQPPVSRQKLTVGPVEELGNMALLDFRRLSADSETVIDSILAKFDVLKNESYLLFLEARKAWFNSPLYITYKTALVLSINSGISLSDGLAKNQGGSQLSENELLAIAAINSKLT